MAVFQKTRKILRYRRDYIRLQNRGKASIVRGSESTKGKERANEK